MPNEKYTYHKNQILSGRWKLIEFLGSGGNSVVWKVIDTSHEEQKYFALKIIDWEHINKKSKSFQRVKDEIQIHNYFTSQKNKHILPLIEFNLPEVPSETDPVWILMPIAVTAEKELLSTQHVDIDRILKCILDISKGLQERITEKPEFLHRDIKPQNIFLHEGNWCLGDFGLADFENKREITQTKDRIGSMHFIAPEALANNECFSEKSEVYALAKSLYCLISRKTFPPPGMHHFLEEHTTIDFYISDSRNKEINSLLVQSTCNIDKRITLESFIGQLNLLTKKESETSTASVDFTSILNQLKLKTESDRDQSSRKVEVDNYIGKLNRDCGIRMESFLSSIGVENNALYVENINAILISLYYQRTGNAQPVQPYGAKYCNVINMPAGQNSIDLKKNMFAGVNFITYPNDKVLIIAGILFFDNDMFTIKYFKDYFLDVVPNSVLQTEEIMQILEDLLTEFPKFMTEFVESI